MFVKTLSVSALNSYIKKTLDHDFILNNLSISGEISNFKIHTSGHAYFSLKDDKSKINCVMFYDDVKNLNFMPKDGMRVLAKGRISVYMRDGAYELYAKELSAEGEGELSEAFLRLKEKLKAEGLFDERFKKRLPDKIENIGVITSETGAAAFDIINVIKRRNPLINIYLYPSLVQGLEAPHELIEGINVLNKRKDIDVIILARGGGSIEELWAFNDENLARAVFKSKKPIVTGVGHETDFTIADFVSDLRAPTPSAAAELCTVDVQNIIIKIEDYRRRLKVCSNSIYINKLNSFNNKNNMLSKNNPEEKIKAQCNLVNARERLLINSFKNYIENNKNNLLSKINLLESKSPASVLKRGYSIAEDASHNIIKSPMELKNLDRIILRFFHGTAEVRIKEVVMRSGEEK